MKELEDHGFTPKILELQPFQCSKEVSLRRMKEELPIERSKLRRGDTKNRNRFPQKVRIT